MVNLFDQGARFRSERSSVFLMRTVHMREVMGPSPFGTIGVFNLLKTKTRIIFDEGANQGQDFPSNYPNGPY